MACGCIINNDFEKSQKVFVRWVRRNPTHPFSLVFLKFLYRQTYHFEATATRGARAMNAASRKGQFNVGYDCKWPSSNRSERQHCTRIYK